MYRSARLKLILLTISVWCTSFTSSYNILGLFPYPAKSHFVVFEALLTELAKRGHNVTVYSSFPRNEPISNYREVSVAKCFSLPKYMESSGIEHLKRFENMFTLLTYPFFEFAPTYEELKSCKPLLDLWNSTARNYDLMLTETFHTDFFKLYSYRFDIPFINFHSCPALPWMSDAVGLPDNPSYIPYAYATFTTEAKGFLQRLENFLIYTYSRWIYKQKSSDVYDEIAREIFGSVPSLIDVERNTSLLFLNSHFTINVARPLPPAVVEVSGLTIKQANRLPQVSIFTL